jgi:small nuclear ribonucleoprotein (snRNP)-like protein
MTDNPTIATIEALLADRREKLIIVYTLKRKYSGILKYVDASANMILDCNGIKVFVKRDSLISFELMKDDQ